MDAIVAATVIGGLYPASLAAFVVQFVRLRSDMHVGFDRLEARFDRLFGRLDRGFDRIEARVDGLIATPDRSGRLTDLDDSGAND